MNPPLAYGIVVKLKGYLHERRMQIAGRSR
jgi:hypothetical protein